MALYAFCLKSFIERSQFYIFILFLNLFVVDVCFVL